MFASLASGTHDNGGPRTGRAWKNLWCVGRRAEPTLSVGGGEMVALLGPSGCGKTTTLRMVAGFVDPTAGRIVLDGRDITRVAANRRDIGMVFQSYALFLT